MVDTHNLYLSSLSCLASLDGLELLPGCRGTGWWLWWSRSAFCSLNEALLSIQKEDQDLRRALDPAAVWPPQRQLYIDPTGREATRREGDPLR